MPAHILNCKWVVALVVGAIILLRFVYIAEKKNIQLDLRVISWIIFKLIAGIYVAVISLIQVSMDFWKGNSTLPSEIFAYAFVMGIIEGYYSYRSLKKEYAAINGDLKVYESIDT